MKHSWSCWNDIKYVAFATWHNQKASFKFNDLNVNVAGYNYKYFHLGQKVCPDGWFYLSDANKCFKYFSLKKSWSQSNEYCKSITGNRVTKFCE